MAWVEVGERCFARRYETFNVAVGVVVGSDGLLVIDTRGATRQGHEVVSDLRHLSPLPVRWVVNTHWHGDHTFGNAALAELGAPIYAHATVPSMLAEWGEPMRDALMRRAPDVTEEVEQTVITPPTETFASELTLDLGDRQVELTWPGRGHTEGDIVIRVSDADVMYAGDLIKSATPPSYSPGAFPLEWPATLDAVAALLSADTAVVPGHGHFVDKAFLTAQRDELASIERTIRALWESGVPADEALAAGTWPYEERYVRDAVSKGYEDLGLGGR